MTNLKISFPFLIGNTELGLKAITSLNIELLNLDDLSSDKSLSDAIKWDSINNKFTYLGINNWTIGTDGYWYLNGSKSTYKATGDLSINVDGSTILNNEGVLKVGTIQESNLPSATVAKLGNPTFNSLLSNSTEGENYKFKLNARLLIPNPHITSIPSPYIEDDDYIDLVRALVLNISNTSINSDILGIIEETFENLTEDLDYLFGEAYPEYTEMPTLRLLFINNQLTTKVQFQLLKTFEWEEEPSLHSYILIYNNSGYLVYCKYYGEDDLYVLIKITRNINDLDADIKKYTFISTDLIINSSGTTQESINESFDTRLDTLENKPTPTTSIQVNNTTKSPVNGVITLDDYYTKTSADNTFINKNALGNSVATLVNGKVPNSLLPGSLIDPIIAVNTYSSLPTLGNTSILYYVKDEDKYYRWISTSLDDGYYILTSGGGTSDLELGETDTTAYRGDRGKKAYEHTLSTGNPHLTMFKDIIGRPNTLSGYGITDAPPKEITISKTGLNYNNTYTLKITTSGEPLPLTTYSLERNLLVTNDKITEFIYVPSNGTLRYTSTKNNLVFYSTNKALNSVAPISVRPNKGLNNLYYYTITDTGESIIFLKYDTITSTDIILITGNALDLKVNVEYGKGLSTNDYTDIEKSKLASLKNATPELVKSMGFINTLTYGSKALKTTTGVVDIVNAVNEIVTNSGFTKNTGTYNKPTEGIPTTDLADKIALTNLIDNRFSYTKINKSGLSTTISDSKGTSITFEFISATGTLNITTT